MAEGTLSIKVSSSGRQPKIKFRVFSMQGRGQLFFSFEDLFAAASGRNVWGEASGRGTQVAYDEALGAGCFVRASGQVPRGTASRTSWKARRLAGVAFLSLRDASWDPQRPTMQSHCGSLSTASRP